MTIYYEQQFEFLLEIVGQINCNLNSCCCLGKDKALASILSKKNVIIFFAKNRRPSNIEICQTVKCNFLSADIVMCQGSASVLCLSIIKRKELCRSVLSNRIFNVTLFQNFNSGCCIEICQTIGRQRAVTFELFLRVCLFRVLLLVKTISWACFMYIFQNESFPCLIQVSAHSESTFPKYIKQIIITQQLRIRIVTKHGSKILFSAIFSFQ